MTMQEQAVAVLFTYTTDGQTFTDAYREEDGIPDPQLMCERMQAAVGDDFPGALFAVALNERARDIMTNRRMREMGFSDYDHAAINGR